MIDRRKFVSAAGAAAAGLLRPSAAACAQQPAPPAPTGYPQCSVMMWAIAQRGSFEQNLERVAAAGYHFVELVNEPKQWSPAETARLLGRMHTLGLSVDAMAGVTVPFADPAQTDAFLANLRQVAATAKHLGCPQLILTSGPRIASLGDDRQRSACVQALRRALEVLEPAGLNAVIEPIDHLENPPIYLDTVTEAFAIVREVNSPSVKVLYDFFHEQRTHGNLLEKLDGHIAEIGLVHVADVPGRHEPGTGEVNFCSVYRRLAQLGYRGKIAMEFYPTGDVTTTLRQAREQALRCSNAAAPPPAAA